METKIVILQLFFAAVTTVFAEIEMEFTKFPESVTAPAGDNVSFECAVRVPGEKLMWRWRPANGPEDRWKEVSGSSDKEKMSTRLLVEIDENTPSAFYQCVVSYGSVSLASIPAKLSIARINLKRNSPEKRVIIAPLHNTVVLHCKEPISEPPAVLTWWKENSQGQRKQLETPHGVLVIHNATTEDSGTYGCTATNELSGQVVNLPEKTYLKVQHEGSGGVRFLESEDYVGEFDDGVLIQQVRPNSGLRLWCGAVGTPPPHITWSREPRTLSQHGHTLGIDHFTQEDAGVYSCSANGIRRSWKVIALEPPTWEGSAASVNASEMGKAHIACGTPLGQPTPTIQWLLNAEPLKTGKGVRSIGSDLYIERVEKRHAGIVQCFACNSLGCIYDAALLTVVPVQISDQEYPPAAKVYTQLPKRHNRKNPRKHKGVMVPPSRPNVTRMSNESVMVSWSNANHGLPIQFFKVQYKEATDSNNASWHTATHDIPPHIHSYYVDGLIPDRYYKFRIAAVYSNQDNKLGRISNKFYLQHGGFQSPKPPVLVNAEALSPHSIRLNWTWSSGGGVEAEGFYVYYRAVSSAGEYEKVTAPGGSAARSVVLAHLVPDTAYELKAQAYTAQAPSELSGKMKAKTHRAASSNLSTSTEASGKAGSEAGDEGGGRALVTAGGALGATALIVLLIVTLLLCRRAKRPHGEKGSAENTGANGYIPAKVPITITANPMHAESGDGGVEMSFLHNNNCGNTTSNDETLTHSRKNGPTARQYV